MSACLYGVFKDEAKHLEAQLESCSEIADFYVLWEGGTSRDRTGEIMEAWCREHPGVVIRGEEWRGLADAQNRALGVARSQGCDYLFTLGGGEMVRSYAPLDGLGEAAYAVRCFHRGEDGERSQEWWQPNLIRADFACTWMGKTHTYLQPKESPPQRRLDAYEIEDVAYGHRRQSKLRRDRRILEQEHLRDPGNSRTLFYLAQTCFALGDTQAAIGYYTLRAAHPEFEEERWYAQFALAQINANTHEILTAWEARPWRAEPLRMLEFNYRAGGQPEIAQMFKERADTIPLPTEDMLFVHPGAYKT